MNKKSPVRQPPNGKVSIPIEEQFAQLETRFSELQAQVRQAQQLSNLGTAAATFAHEVNNLLTPVLSYVLAAIDAEDLALKNKALAVTVKNVQMLIGMSDRVLEISAAKQANRVDASEVVMSRASAAAGSLRRGLAYAELQSSIARIHNTLGTDPLPDAVKGRDIASLSDAIGAHLAKKTAAMSR